MKKTVCAVCFILLLSLILGACGETQVSEGTTAVTGADVTEASTTETAVTASVETEAEVTTEEPQPQADPTASLDGKKVIFIGNSFVYYGGCVTNGGQRTSDTGWFYRICKANGENVTVTDCTYGGHHLSDFTEAGCKTSGCDVGVGNDLLKGLDLSSYDYVFISESGDNNANFLNDVQNVVNRFTNPKTRFFYLCHTYSYTNSHTNITGNLAKLQGRDVNIVDWGHLVYDVYKGTEKIESSAVTYSKTTFINGNGSDTYHPNPLGGYITALCAYCAVTSKTAVGQSYDAKNLVKYGKGSTGYGNYAATYYTAGKTTNFTEVFDSAADMLGLQKLVDKYLAKWGLGVGTVPPESREVCEHSYDTGVVSVEPTSLVTGVRTYTCTKCGATKTEVIPKLESARTNLALGKSCTVFSTKYASVGTGSNLTDGNIGNNTSGKVDGAIAGKGNEDSYGGKAPAADTVKVKVTVDGAEREYWYGVRLDLGEGKTVDGICIYAHGYKTTVLDGGVDLLVSSDGVNWTSVYSSTDMFTGVSDEKGWDNYIDSTSAGADDHSPAYLLCNFAEMTGIRYVMYGCTVYREINGYYCTRFTEFEVYGK